MMRHFKRPGGYSKEAPWRRSAPAVSPILVQCPPESWTGNMWSQEMDDLPHPKWQRGRGCFPFQFLHLLMEMPRSVLRLLKKEEAPKTCFSLKVRPRPQLHGCHHEPFGRRNCTAVPMLPPCDQNIRLRLRFLVCSLLQRGDKSPKWQLPRLEGNLETLGQTDVFKEKRLWAFVRPLHRWQQICFGLQSPWFPFWTGWFSFLPGCKPFHQFLYLFLGLEPSGGRT